MHYSEHLEQIVANGFAVVDGFMPSATSAKLSAEIHDMQNTDLMKHAGTSKQAMLNSNIRGDFTYWLDAADCSVAQRVYLTRMEELRLAFNQSFFLSLTEFECHLAAYPVGSFYKKHLDQFKDKAERKISAILYLNQDWSADDGGVLRLYLDENKVEPYLDIAPIAGRLVLFESARFWHEVLPAKRERLSVTGWFRTRSDFI